MQALNVMTLAVTTIHPEASIQEAHTLMLKLGIRHLPVVSGGKLMGMLSDRDVLLCVGRQSDDFVYPQLRVGERMSCEPVTGAIHTSVGDLARRMLEHKIGAVPIVSQRVELLGLVTSSDLLRLVVALPNGLALHLAAPDAMPAQRY